ncbi:MAG: hypothetical protein ACFB01_00485 [Cohaesibacteraceae bacterium]
MLGIGLAGQGTGSTLPAFARSAALAIDFSSGFAVRNGQLVSPNDVLTVQRAEPAYAEAADGTLHAFSANTPRITSAGLWLDAGATRLHGEAPFYGSKSGGSASSTLLPPEGAFTPRLFTGGGADWHQWQAGIGALAADEPRFFRVRYRTGTSGRCFISLIANASPSDTFAGLAGPAGNLATAGTSAGSLVEVEQRLLGADTYEVSGVFLPNAAAPSATIGVGPHSTVSGETINILGFQITDRPSQWIMGGSDALSQDADSSLIDLAGADLSGGFVLRLDGILPTTYQSDSYARLYQASPASSADRVQTYLRASDLGVGMEQHVGGVVQNGYPTLAQPVQAGGFSLVTGHGPDFIGGQWNAMALVSVTTPASYVAPTQIALGRDDLYQSAHACLLIERLALYAGPPSAARLTEIAAF